jgi:hypothetical protein
MESFYSSVYGFDGYDAKELGYYALYSKTLNNPCNTGKYLIPEKCLINSVSKNNTSTINFDTVKSVYIHPSCKMPRILLDKYKKVLDPWKADICIVDDNVINNFSANVERYPYIVKDDKKIIYIINRPSYLKELLNVDDVVGHTLSEIPNSYFGEIANLPLCEENFLSISTRVYSSYLIKQYQDIRLGLLPKDKVVSDTDVLNYISGKNNTLDVDTMMSIYDLVKSSDKDTKVLGLKTLSLLDYIHYPNSARFIIGSINSLQLFKPSIASITYMYKKLDIRKCSDTSFWGKTLSKKDFEMLAQLRSKIDKCNIEDLYWGNTCFK